MQFSEDSLKCLKKLLKTCESEHKHCKSQISRRLEDGTDDLRKGSQIAEKMMPHHADIKPLCHMKNISMMNSNLDAMGWELT